MARLGEWDAILKEPAPPNDLVYTAGMWHYARGLAFSAKGRLDDAGPHRSKWLLQPLRRHRIELSAL